MIVTVVKQKIGQKIGMSNGRKVVDFDPRYNRLEPLNTRRVNLNDL